LLEETNLSHD
jgi:hypothetical protein